MQLRYAFFLLLLPFVTAQAVFHYELHGSLSSVSADHIRGIETNRARFVDQEGQIRTELAKSLSEELPSFFVNEFQIHGDDVQRSTAIFYAYVSSTKSRDQFLGLVKSSDSLHLFFMRQIESLPAVPEAVDDVQSNCLYGGIALPNATCYCPPFISGPNCENVMCLNGGISDNNRCACPPGLYSVNCEPRGCLPQIQGNFDNSKQTFILVLNQRSSMSYVINQIILNIGNTINVIGANSANLVDNFVLVNYIDTAHGFYMNTVFFTDQSEFTAYLAGITTSDGKPEQYTNRAIYIAQSFHPYMHGFSNIFVFADTTDVALNPPTFTISENSDEVNAITQTIAWRNRIIYFFAQPKGTPIDVSMNDYDVFRRVAASTLGDIVSFDLREIDEILQHVLPTYKQNEVIAATYNNQPNQLPQSVVIPASDAGSIIVALSVEPNGVLPTITSTPAPSVISLCSRFHLLQFPADSITIKVLSLSSAWSLRAFVNSANTALLAYSMDPQIDIGTSYIPAELAPSISGALIGFTGTPLFSFINNTEGTTAPVRAQARAGECSFPLNFGNVAAPIPAGPQMIQMNLAGGAIRVIPGFSGYLDHHFAVPYNCFNGGTRTGPSTCTCADQFEGSNCAIPKCQFGGKVNPFPGNGQPLCLCPQGYGGDHCEILSCNSTGNDFTFSNDRTLALVLQSTMSQAQINSKIGNGLNTLINALQGADAFSQYVLTTFNNIISNNKNYTDIQTSTFEDSSNFLHMVRSDNVEYKASQTPTQDSFGALYKSMYVVKNDKSSIFLFVDAPVESEYEKNFVIMSAVARQLEISIIITPPYGMQDLCMLSSDADEYATIAQKTGGVIVNLCNPITGIYSTDPITQFFIGYAASHHHTENLNEVLDISGDSKSTLKFFIDDTANPVFVFVNSVKTESFTVTLDNLDNGQKTTLSPIANMPFLGIYSVTPTFGNKMGYLVTTTTGSQAISLRIAEKTQNAVYMGFSLMPSVDRQFTSMPYGSQFSPVIHLFGPATNGLTSPPTVSLNIATDGGTSLYTGSSVIRSSFCQYESYFTAPFVCPTASKTYILTTTVTTPSVTYQRTQRGYCYLPDSTCLNGGAYNYTSQDCDCPANYLGPNCEFPLCQNGGNLTNFVCVCPTGFAGTFCQYGTCETWNFLETHDVREQTFKQVTFVLNRNVDQLMVNVYLSYRIQEFVDQTESNEVPTQYSLITFDDLGVYDIVSSVHKSVFIQAFKNSINAGTRPAATQTKAMDALYEAYKLNIQPPNIIYVFTGSDTMLTSQGISNFIRQRIGTQVNLFYTPAQVSSGFPDQPTGNLKTYFTTAARQSGGRVLPLTQNSVSSLTPVLISSKQETSLIHDDAAKDCSNGVKFNFFVESTVISVVIDITGNGVNDNKNVAISAGSGNITIQPSNIIFSDQAAIVYNIKRTDINIADQMWTVTVKTLSGSCFIQARAASPVRVVPGFTSSPTQDFVKSAPFTFQSANYDQLAYMTFRIVDNGFTDGYGSELNTVTIMQTEYYQTFTSYPILRNLKIKPRDPTNCANQFIAGPWQVDKAGSQKFIVTGKTSDNSQFQRTFYFNLPSTKDDKLTCVHGSRNSHGECNCEVRYSGGYCNDPVCDNGGTSSYGICACVNGYFGDYCDQYIIATPTNTTASPLF